MNEKNRLATEVAAGLILDEWKRISRGAENAGNDGLAELSEMQAETAAILAGLFRQLVGRYPHEARS